MSADAKFAEALARIEHKLDLTMKMVARLLETNPMNVQILQDVQFDQVSNKQHECFLCGVAVEYAIDPVDSIVVRKCNCKTGKIALDMKAFAPPAMPVPKKETDNGEQHEDRRNPPPRSGRR